MDKVNSTEEIYGIYLVTMSDGYTVEVNASGRESAIDAILKSGMVNAPKSAFRNVQLIRQMPLTSKDFVAKKVMESELLATANAAYADGGGWIDDSTLIAGERGDPLADFIAFGITDACAGHVATDCKAKSLERIHTAIADLQRVALAIEQVDV